MIIEGQIETYISSPKGEKTDYLRFKKAYGVLRVELGRANIIFKTEDLKKILGDEE